MHIFLKILQTHRIQIQAELHQVFIWLQTTLFMQCAKFVFAGKQPVAIYHINYKKKLE